MSISLLFNNSNIDFFIRRRSNCFCFLACLGLSGLVLFFDFFVFGGCGTVFPMLVSILFDKITSPPGETFEPFGGHDGKLFD